MSKHSHHGNKNVSNSNSKHHDEDKELHFSPQEAYNVAKCLDIDFGSCGYDLEQFRSGMDVELEHGRVNRRTNITDNDPILTGKIALAHLNEFPDYYTRLTKMERDADRYWSKRKKATHEDKH
jgi:hypothetical protein